MNAEGNDRGGLRGRAAGLTRTGTLGVGVLVVAALLGMVNYFGWKYHARLDWTATKLYSLSEKTENVLSRGSGATSTSPSSSSPATSSTSRPGRSCRATRRRRPTSSSASSTPARTRWRPSSWPRSTTSRAPRWCSPPATTGRWCSATPSPTSTTPGVQLGRTPEIRGFKGEQLFTAALIDLADPKKPKVLFTTGHGEHKLDDLSPAGLGEAQRLLKDDNFDLQEWAVAGGQGGAGGHRPGGRRRAHLDLRAAGAGGDVPAYLDRGGRMLLLLDPVISAGRQAGGDLDRPRGLARHLGVEARQRRGHRSRQPAPLLRRRDPVRHRLRRARGDPLGARGGAAGAGQPRPLGGGRTGARRLRGHRPAAHQPPGLGRDRPHQSAPRRHRPARSGAAGGGGRGDGEGREAGRRADEEAADLDETAEAKDAAADAKAGAPDADEAKKDDGGGRRRTTPRSRRARCGWWSTATPTSPPTACCRPTSPTASSSPTPSTG